MPRRYPCHQPVVIDPVNQFGVDLNPFVRGWAGLGRVFRLQPVARVAIAGWLDPTAPALRRLDPVEDARSALSRAPAAQGPGKSASAAIFSPKGPWRLSFSEALHRAFTKARFRRLGLISMEKLANA